MWKSNGWNGLRSSLRPRQDIQHKERDESSNSIGHEDYHPIWLEDGTLLELGTIILILKSIGGQITLNFLWFFKDEKAMDWREGFPQLPLDKENKLKEGSWKAWEESSSRGLFLVWFFLGRGGEREWVLEDGAKRSGLEVGSTSKK